LKTENLHGQELHLRTDHCALTWLLTSKNLEGQTARWVQRLREYNFTSKHRQGRKHTNADALSRRPSPEQCTTTRKSNKGQEAWGCDSSLLPERIIRTAPPPPRGSSSTTNTWADPTESWGSATSQLERHRWPELHLWELLGPVKIPGGVGWRATASLGVGGRKNENSIHSPFPEQGEINTDKIPRKNFGRTPWSQQDTW
jgi:hypothetical protein